jgi:hypothetical protein
MLRRTRATHGKPFRDYAQRGITACERWLTFENFLADMGTRPSPKHSIDRINNDGNYEPGNCRWAMRGCQQHNQRIRRNNTTGARGVILDKRRGTYKAEITHNGRAHYLGTFSDVPTASRAYQSALERINRGEEPCSP